jgi:hypothetical protein
VRKTGAASLAGPVSPGRSLLPYTLASLAILAPCFWQSRLQAGDLGSHIYNAWLAQLIYEGKAPGLEIVGLHSNVLFDWMLSGLFAAGAGAAQRTAVAAAVLVFVWGAFAFASVAGRRSWAILPVLAMLAYGWVYHMGFFNFYLSLGLCFWAVAAAWPLKPVGAAAAVPLLVLAYLAHALPVAWAVAVLAYVWLARHLPSDKRGHLVVSAVACLALLHVLLSLNLMTRWTYFQVKSISGADQVHVFGGKYLWIAIALFLLWCMLLITLGRQRGARNLLSSELLQVSALTAAGVFLLPTWVLPPGYHHPLVYISDRMSLAVGVCLMAALSQVQMRPYQRYAVAILALVFFGFLYGDERALNRLEDQVQHVIQPLKPGDRVVGAIDDPALRVNALAHMVDRACIAHCSSYGNYEPSSGQFRIRATGRNALVTANDLDSAHMEAGTYIVQPGDVPFYRITADPGGTLHLESVPAGKQIALTPWRGL